jgi:hypothetical protein
MSASNSADDSSRDPSGITYYLDTLKLSLPLALAAFAVAVIAFLVVDGAREAEDVETRKFREGQQALAVGIVELNAIRGESDSSVMDFNRVVSEIEAALIASDLDSFVPAVREVKLLNVLFGAKGMQQTVEQLYSIQMAVSKKILAKGPTVRHNYFALGHGIVTALTKRIQMSVLSAELRMNARRAMDGATIAIACSPLGSQYLSTFLPELVEAGSCDPAAKRASAAVQFNTNLIKGRFNKLDIEFAKMQEAITDFAASQESYRDEKYASALGLKLAALLVAAIGAIFGFYLVIVQHQSLKEHSVVESDFAVHGSTVCIKHHTMHIVDDLCLNIGTMESCDASPYPQQTELNIRKAIKPLTMIRPFVPSYMFVRSLRSRSIFNANAKNLLKNRNLLNLTVGFRKKQAGILFVGLRQYNTAGADVDSFSELFVAVQLACDHFQGNIVQVNADGMLAIFSQGQINEDEDNEQVKDGEVLATHAAFAILELCKEQMEVEDDQAQNPAERTGNSPVRVRRPAIPVSMVVSQSHTLQGLTSFHVSRQFSLLSPAVSSSLAVEPVSNIHHCPIMTTQASVSLLDGFFILRPVHYIPTEGSVYHIIAEELQDDDDSTAPKKNEALIKEIAKLKEKVQKWTKVWEKYEALMASERPTFEMLEESHRDLEGYKVFHMHPNETDSAYDTAVASVKKVAQSMGVSLGNTVEED